MWNEENSSASGAGVLGGQDGTGVNRLCTSPCTSSDQLLNFFRLVAEVAVQQKSANSAIATDP